MHCSEYEAESLCLLSNLSKMREKRFTMNYHRVTQTPFFFSPQNAKCTFIFCLLQF